MITGKFLVFFQHDKFPHSPQGNIVFEPNFEIRKPCEHIKLLFWYIFLEPRIKIFSRKIVDPQISFFSPLYSCFQVTATGHCGPTGHHVRPRAAVAPCSVAGGARTRHPLSVGGSVRGLTWSRSSVLPTSVRNRWVKAFWIELIFEILRNGEVWGEIFWMELESRPSNGMLFYFKYFSFLILEMTPCFQVVPPVDGGWSDWSGWGVCSVNCGAGIQSRTRFCNNPYPANDGAECSGSPIEYKRCNIQPCQGEVFGVN